MFRIDRTRISYVKAEEVYVSIDPSAVVQEVIQVSAEPEAPPPVVKTNEEAEKVIAAAKEEAARMNAEAQAEKSDVLEAAYREGFAKGEADGAAVYQQLCEQLAETLRKLLLELRQENQRAREAFEKGFTDLVFSVAEKVLHAKLERDDTSLSEIVRSALAAADHEEKLTVLLSTEDCSRLFPEGCAHYIINNESVSAAVVEKPEFRRGDCIVLSESETIDAGIASQLRCIEIAFRKEADAHEPD